MCLINLIFSRVDKVSLLQVNAEDGSLVLASQLNAVVLPC